MAVRTMDAPWEPASINYLALVVVIGRNNNNGPKLERCLAFDTMKAAMDAANYFRVLPDKPGVEVWVWDMQDGVFKTHARCVCYTEDNEAWSDTLVNKNGGKAA